MTHPRLAPMTLRRAALRLALYPFLAAAAVVAFIGFTNPTAVHQTVTDTGVVVTQYRGL